ncbi:FadR/GntR family transcriptional regulator [Parafrankia sp. FMc2]|uniref:FadR/GntR family transcriptional regulator n=1 Tax=Parafrankia sp. FMc2 TaxID=3233196 RepID=UPI0034D3A0A8
MAELAAAELRRHIIRGDLAEGDALPSESELMEQFGISRPTLREAFRVLESESLIAIRRGAHGGARVQPPRREVAARYAGFILEYQGTTLRDVYEARVALEVPSVGQLARRHTTDDLEVLTKALEQHEAVPAEDSLEAVRLHSDFHVLVVRLAGNETLALLSEMLHHIIEVANTSLQPDAGPLAERALRSTAKTHRKLVKLIRARDAKGAEELWRRHLNEAEGYLLGDDVGSTVLDLLG